MNLDKTLILNKLKNYYSFKKDSDFARFLEIKPQTLASWYSRGTFDIDILYAKCNNISADFLLTGKGEMFKGIEIPVENAKNLVEKMNLLEEQNEILKDSKTQLQEIIVLYKEKIEFIERKLHDCEDEKKHIKNIS
ncbi:helix-turn-helix domain containing protein [Flavobacterium sp. LS1R47]|uniref:Helix-turn-helix domain containing protein n=1 Tax=Flavobacterium frigoritolerans TaxID=2987686 RepID=A0A9X3CAM5_9FLAO|nr:helix-turn-helix domain containing protein [Flavobacterium frigoritolerans]MCV9934678.1 helix-turn-helix domain containing protein [Flavobacterium frigoritolerans]